MQKFVCYLGPRIPRFLAPLSLSYIYKWARQLVLRYSRPIQLTLHDTKASKPTSDGAFSQRTIYWHDGLYDAPFHHETARTGYIRIALSCIVESIIMPTSMQMWRRHVGGQNCAMIEVSATTRLECICKNRHVYIRE